MSLKRCTGESGNPKKLADGDLILLVLRLHAILSVVFTAVALVPRVAAGTIPFGKNVRAKPKAVVT
jgi:hypothetical protein